jgi:type IV pilus assembly protein PilE
MPSHATMVSQQIAPGGEAIPHRLAVRDANGRRVGRHGLRGFTLTELLVVMAAAGLLVAIAWPSFASQLTKARRADATSALQRLEAQQGRHHALHGRYATDAGALGAAGSALSGQGLYRIELRPGPGEGFTAVAHARAGAAQAADRECAAITLRVELGFAQRGPSAACWAR